MKTLVFVTEGTEEIEAITVIDVLRRADVQVQAVSITDLKRYQGAHGIWSSADLLIEDLEKNLDGLGAIVIPGGMEGVKNLKADHKLLALIKEANEKSILLAAICAGPLVLKEAGVLEGRTFTAYPGLEDELGVALEKDDLIRDENILSSRGPATAMAFALAIVEELKGQETRDRVAKDLLFN